MPFRPLSSPKCGRSPASRGLTTGFKATLRTRFGLPGQYDADILPTKDGAYRFRITGKIERIHRTQIEERTAQAKSLMPDDLAQQMSQREFLDLLAFLLERR